MKSLDERIDDIKEDPKKLRRAFTVAWVAAYSMLVLGAVIIIWVLLSERLLS